MLDKKSIQIMNYLINEEEISLTKLMSKTSLSKKQILYALDHINSFLLENDRAALSIFKENIILTSENKQFFIDCFINNTLFTDYLLDADERIKYIFFLIFNKPSDYLSISGVAVLDAVGPVRLDPAGGVGGVFHAGHREIGRAHV